MTAAPQMVIGQSARSKPSITSESCKTTTVNNREEDHRRSVARQLVLEQPEVIEAKDGAVEEAGVDHRKSPPIRFERISWNLETRKKQEERKKTHFFSRSIAELRRVPEWKKEEQKERKDDHPP